MPPSNEVRREVGVQDSGRDQIDLSIRLVVDHARRRILAVRRVDQVRGRSRDQASAFPTSMLPLTILRPVTLELRL